MGLGFTLPRPAVRQYADIVGQCARWKIDWAAIGGVDRMRCYNCGMICGPYDKILMRCNKLPSHDTDGDDEGPGIGNLKDDDV